MLYSDPKQRLTAAQVLSMIALSLSLSLLHCVAQSNVSSPGCVASADHPWIKEDGEAPDTPLDNAVFNRFKQFRAMNKFKKVALRVSVTN